jgi:ABC-type siderophore export system fused ATPase/permease subunit
MRLLRLLAQVSALQFTIAIFVSALGGVCAMGAIICVLESLRSGNILWWEFASVAALSVVIARFSRATLGGLAAKSIVRLRRRLVRSLLRVPLVDLERIGPTRLLVAFTSDLASVGSAVRQLCVSLGIVGLHRLAVADDNGCYVASVRAVHRRCRRPALA